MKHFLTLTLVAAALSACSSEPTKDSMNTDGIAKAIAAHSNDFLSCYESQKGNHSDGRVNTKFEIGADGKVTKASIDSSTLHQPQTEACILDVIRKTRFPLLKGAGVVEVTYPFKFSPAAKK